MNKILNLLLALLMISFVSCREDADTPDTGAVIHPEKEAAGTYSGTWEVFKGEDKELQASYPGTITIAPSEYAYVCSVTTTCDGYAEIGGTGAANILKQSRAYKFYNETTTNGLGSVFQGAIDFNGDASMSYSKAVKSGRVTTMFYFEFVGHKN